MALGVQAVTTTLLRFCAAAAVALGAWGCANSDKDAFRLSGLIVQALTGGPSVTREQAAGIPYASLGVRLGSSGEGVAVLGKRTGDDRYWYSGETMVFVTRAGRVTQTAGLPYDLTRLETRTPTGGPTTPGASPNFVMVFDFQSLGAFNVVAHCTDTDEGLETISILSTSIQTRHHVEHCEADALDWSFENEFWLDAKTGFVWQSEQEIHPRSPTLKLSVFRPESGPAPASMPETAPTP